MYKRVCWTLAFSFMTKLIFAHALHPDSIDRFADITLTPTQIAVVYELVLGMNPTEKATRKLDPNDDGVITDTEREAFLAEAGPIYAAQQIVEIAGRRIELQYRMGDAYAALGHNAINVIKIDLGLVAQIPSDIPRNATVDFFYRDLNILKIPGWKQIRFQTQNDVAFAGHIPYREYKPFDYEILNTKGFSPSTDEIRLHVRLPEALEPSIVSLDLPARVAAMDVRIGLRVEERDRQGNRSVLLLIVTVALFLIGGSAFIWWKIKSRE